jgi:hypothetical protein
VVPLAKAAGFARVSGAGSFTASVAMPAVTLIEANSAAERDLAFRVRRRVFVGEQGIAERLEFDAEDATATHLLALLDEEAVGTLRVRLIEGGGTAKVERVAVLASACGSFRRPWI